jgi:hypothetical protein
MKVWSLTTIKGEEQDTVLYLNYAAAVEAAGREFLDAERLGPFLEKLNWNAEDAATMLDAIMIDDSDIEGEYFIREHDHPWVFGPEPEAEKFRRSRGLPPDPEEMNAKRAEWALRTIEHYANSEGGESWKGFNGAQKDALIEQNLSDLLAQFGHFCDRNGISLQGMLRRAAGHYTEETANRGTQSFDASTDGGLDREQPDAAQRYRDAANRRYGRDGELEIDDGAIVSVGDDPGAYVQAWVWVSNEEAGIKEDEEDEEDDD